MRCTRAAGAAAASVYWQREARGLAVGSLVLADGHTARLIGVHEQLVDPAPGQPWRFAGTVGPLPLTLTQTERLQQALARLSHPHIARLLDAGAALVGKTVTDEFAFSMNGNNAHFGAPINGAAPDRISGGSSSGSASAVSSGLCDFALGTDTGGSVRAPASHCGLVGLRPTHGRVSLEGALDLAPSQDTCGWFARDVPALAEVLNTEPVLVVQWAAEPADPG